MAGGFPVPDKSMDARSRLAIQKLKTKLGAGGVPTFSGIILDGLTASRIIATNINKTTVSITDLTAWIAGTANRVTVADDGDGTVTLSGPQDIHTGATPTFSGVTVTNVLTVAGDGVFANADRFFISTI